MSGNTTRRAFLGAALAGIAATVLDCSGKSSETNGSGLETAVNEAPAQEKIDSPKQQVLEITRDNYREVLGLDIKDKAELDSRSPIFVKFYTDTCPPCRAIDPAYKEVAGRFYRKDAVFAQYKCTFNIPSRGKYFNPEQPTEIPIVEEWGVCGVPDIVLLYQGEKKYVLGVADLVKMRGDDGAAGFQNIVDGLLRKHCPGCDYLKRETTK